MDVKLSKERTRLSSLLATTTGKVMTNRNGLVLRLQNERDPYGYFFRPNH